MAIKIAITGGIGSGKSVLSQELKTLGYPVYDCDSEAKRLMTDDPQLVSSLKRLIGEMAYNADGSLNRQHIASYVFSAPEHTMEINHIVHPAVIRDFEKWAANKDICFVESAILYESGFDKVVDKVVLVHADREERIRRTMVRDGATRNQIESRMDRQMNEDEAKRKADYIFDNTKFHTKEDTQKLINYIKKLC